MTAEERKALRRKRRWSVLWLVLTALGVVLSVWGAWDAWHGDDRWVLFRRVVGAFLFLFWFTQRYGAYRSLRREG
jgi:hypothetical protein